MTFQEFLNEIPAELIKIDKKCLYFKVSKVKNRLVKITYFGKIFIMSSSGWQEYSKENTTLYNIASSFRKGSEDIRSSLNPNSRSNRSDWLIDMRSHLTHAEYAYEERPIEDHYFYYHYYKELLEEVNGLLELPELKECDSKLIDNWTSALSLCALYKGNVTKINETLKNRE